MKENNEEKRKNIPEEQPPDSHCAADLSGRYQALQKQNRKMGKQLILFSAAFFGILLLLGAGILILQNVLKTGDDTETTSGIRFYPTYQGDIFDFPEYMALDRTVSYCQNPDGYGETVSITEENAGEFNSEVLFLRNWIRILTLGDKDLYNACFTENYFRTHQKQDSFSPQMVYQTVICYNSVTSDPTTGERLVTYRLSYRIHRNDGTLRRDVGSDAVRPQYAVLRIAKDGTVGIDDLYTK